jgi:ADP-ribosylglycohydrolase
MFGAIIGDICGSKYEWRNTHDPAVPLADQGCQATDDTVLILATLTALTKDRDYAKAYRRFWRLTPDVGYGPRFAQWAAQDGAPATDSCGNGPAMRAAPIGWLIDDFDAPLREADTATLVSHQHPDAVAGARAVVAGIILLRQGMAPEAVARHLALVTGYAFTIDPQEVRRRPFDATCAGSVPQAVWAALTADGFEAALRLAISLGGDSDTIACITGALAEARFGLPRAAARLGGPLTW